MAILNTFSQSQHMSQHFSRKICKFSNWLLFSLQDRVQGIRIIEPNFFDLCNGSRAGFDGIMACAKLSSHVV